MSIIQGTAKQASTRGFYDFPLEQSLRFNDDDSAYLSRTPASAGNRKTWTWSGWVKRGRVDNANTEIFGTAPEGDKLSFTDSRIFWFNEGSSQSYLSTTALFRDPSAWYHIILAFDTTQATASNRVKLYVNGEQVAFDNNTTFPTQNYDGDISNAQVHYIGRAHGSNYFDGYLAEVNFIGGTALDASSFGELKNGVWIPKDPSELTYGTNGFHLDFANSADIGNDVSGEGNDWTPNNFTASDVVLDSPTDNFCTLTPLNKTDGNVVLSDGNLDADLDQSSGWNSALATFALDMSAGGKFYWEATANVVSSSDKTAIGMIPDKINFIGNTNKSIVDTQDFGDNPKYGITGHGAGVGGYSYAQGDVINVAVDIDNAKVYYGKNGTYFGDMNPSAGTGGTTQTLNTSAGRTAYVPFVAGYGGSEWQLNFGATAFTHTPPSGFEKLSTANLQNPAIDPAQGESPEDYFNTVLYTGNGSTANDGNTITGVGFQPDFVWLKNRTQSTVHSLQDSVRGVRAVLQSQTTEGENSNRGYLNSFTSDGFTTGDAAGASIAPCNASGNAYVAWSWKAGGSAVTNNDGSISSSVSASTEAGFSVVTTDSHAGSETVGHGLNQKPDWIIAKARNANLLWPVFHTSIGNTKRLRLNDTTAAETNSVWGDTDPTDSVFTFFQSSSSYNYVFYCFHSVEGFSKFSSFVGNGSADGTFVYTGFRPAFVLIKNADFAEIWPMFDDKRDADNQVENPVYANLSSAEGTASSRGLDFLSNGFKIRGTDTSVNRSGDTHIYMAFAENPFKYPNAR